MFFHLEEVIFELAGHVCRRFEERFKCAPQVESLNAHTAQNGLKFGQVLLWINEQVQLDSVDDHRLHQQFLREQVSNRGLRLLSSLQRGCLRNEQV